MKKRATSLPLAEKKLTKDGPFSNIPLYATRPSAGFPTPGDDLVERPLDLNDLLIDNPAATFFVRVAGDSMEEAGIFDGDILIVDRSINPAIGKIVVAAVYGELVVKRLLKHEGSMALVSAKAGYKPIMVADADDVFIWGVVTGSVRIFS
ncbi:MAG: translesion error-prone DNA polymerase V autoproteolytic subunit [Patescibacteria group bacterium]